MKSIQVGTVFAVPLADGRFGAVRVIDTSEEDDSALVAVTPWLGPLPSIDEPKLRDILRQHRGMFKGRPALYWHDGKPPGQLRYLGLIPPSAEDLSIDPSGAYAGAWINEMARDAVLELEGPESPALSAAVPRVKAAAAKPVTPASHALPIAEFWAIIARLDWKKQTDAAVIAPAVSALAKRSVPEIESFHRRLCELLFQLDAEKYARELGENSFGGNAFSPDHFLTVRAAVVANGPDYYASVSADPRQMPRDREFEALLSVAEKALSLKTGQKKEIANQPSYETFSNTSGWTTAP